MKKIAVILFLFNIFAYSNFGLGFIIGEPLSIVAKKWVIPYSQSIDGYIGAGGHETLYAGLDYCWQTSKFTPVKKGKFLLGTGVGAGLYLGSEFDVCARAKLTGDYILADIPLNFFVEITPSTIITEDLKWNLMGGLGVRWFFY